MWGIKCTGIRRDGTPFYDSYDYGHSPLQGVGSGLIPILLMHGFPDEYWRILLLSSEACLAMENSLGGQRRTL